MECHSGTPFFVQVLRRSADDSHNTNECFIEFNCYKYNDLFLFYDGAVSIYCIKNIGRISCVYFIYRIYLHLKFENYNDTRVLPL